MDYKSFLQTEVKPAFGCTDPVAVALAAAGAGKWASGKVLNIHLRLSKNIYKNGLDVGIPGTNGGTGNPLAAALGAISGDPDKGLNVLEAATPQDVEEAKRMILGHKVTMEIVKDSPNVYAEAELKTDQGSVIGVVSERADNLVGVHKGGKTLWQKSAKSYEGVSSIGPYKEDLMALDTFSIWEIASNIDVEAADFLLSGARMNQTVAEQGLAQPWGLGLGYELNKLAGKGELYLYIKAAAAAAADVRMAGGPFPVMSSGGSGNQGITAIVPVTTLARSIDATDRELAESLVLSHLVTGYIKAHTGLLTPICGCAVAAGLGAAMAMVRLLGGSPKNAEIAAANLLSAILGMICDGAKGSCALKVSTSAGEAYLCAKLAMAGRGVRFRQGLVNPVLKEMAHVIGTFSNAELSDMDDKILDLMQEQETAVGYSTCW